MKRIFILALACILLSAVTAVSQTRRRGSAKRPATTFAEKQQAEIRAGRARIAAQIKALTQFLYLLGGISKTIESAEQSSRNCESSALTPEQIKLTRTRVKESIGSVRAGLDELERGFRFNPALTTFYPHLSGVAAICKAAENQTASNNFDESARSLIRAVNKLTDALVAMR
ncbi:MAG: hypothetical protein AB1631_05975 [Acidobacteriota bacterium]